MQRLDNPSGARRLLEGGAIPGRVLFMASANLRLLAGAILALVVVAGAAVTLGYTLLSPGEGSGEPQASTVAGGERVFFQPRSLTLPMGTGSSGTLEFKVYVESKASGESREDEGSLEFSVEGYDWPHARLAYTRDGEEKKGVLPFAMLGLPRELLGSQQLGIPVYIPVADATLCVQASLSKEEGLLVYRGEEVVGTTLVKIDVSYRGDGVLSGIRIEVVDPQAGRLVYEARLIDANPVEEVVDAPWECGGGLYSDIRYAPEGLIEIRDGRVYKVDLETVRRAVESETVLFMVLSKTCPYCQKDWEHLLKLSTIVDVKIYAINAGGLTPQDELTWAVNFARKFGVSGTPGFIAVKDGRVVDVRVGYATAEELAEWLESTLGPVAAG